MKNKFKIGDKVRFISGRYKGFYTVEDINKNWVKLDFTGRGDVDLYYHSVDDLELANEQYVKQLEIKKNYMSIACVIAERSYAVKRKVGCIIVKDGRIISNGYNGTPAGFSNVCELLKVESNTLLDPDNIESIKEAKEHGWKLVTKPEVLHAEANAITKLAKCNESCEGATLYVTTEPCIECAKLIIQTGIKNVIYKDDYHSHDGINLLKKAGVNVEQIKLEWL